MHLNPVRIQRYKGQGKGCIEAWRALVFRMPRVLVSIRDLKITKQIQNCWQDLPINITRNYKEKI